MNRTCKTAVVAGVTGGYLLGRTRKGKLALVLASVFLARRLRVEPQELVKKGVGKVADMSPFSELSEQVRGDLMTAARTALTSTVNRRLDGISDALREQTDAMSDAGGGADREKADAEEAEQDGEDEAPPAPQPGKTVRKTDRESGRATARSTEKRASRRETSRDAKAIRR